MFNQQWVWHLHLLNFSSSISTLPLVISFPQGSQLSVESRNYTSFDSVNDFKKKVEWKKNHHLYEVLMSNSPRHFFADLEWDSDQLPNSQLVFNTEDDIK